MLGPADLGGVCGMLPACGTDDAGSVKATRTVDTGRVAEAVTRSIDDGIDSLAVAMTSGEFHTLLWCEQQELVRVAIEAAGGRVPVLVACVSMNTRETLRRIAFAREAGADGVVVGVPHYVPSTQANAVGFLNDVADAFPDVAMMIYHNPILHRVRLPVDAFDAILSRPNVVAMKDSHRTPEEFAALIAAARGRMSVLCHESQLGALGPMGAAGVWSMGWFMDPRPVAALRAAHRAGDWTQVAALAERLGEAYATVNPVGQASPEVAMERALVVLKLATSLSGYCEPGPLRPPFTRPSDEQRRAARELSDRWAFLAADVGTPVGAS